MASYTIDTAKTATLTSGVPDKINFSSDNPPTSVLAEVINLDGTIILWVAINGATAAVEGDNSVPVRPLRTFRPAADVVTLQVVASGTPKYTVRRIN